MGQCTYQKIEAFLAAEHVSLASFSGPADINKFNRLLNEVRVELQGERYVDLEMGVGEIDGKDIIIRRGINLEGKSYLFGIIPDGNWYSKPEPNLPVFFLYRRWRSGGDDYHLFQIKQESHSPRALQVI
jgi:hypothetical protein